VAVPSLNFASQSYSFGGYFVKQSVAAQTRRKAARTLNDGVMVAKAPVVKPLVKRIEHYSTAPALFLSFVILCTLIVPIVIRLPGPNEKLWDRVGWIAWGLFTIEYLVRLTAATERKAFVRSNVTDLVVILSALPTPLVSGNQEALLALVRRETLTAQEVSGVIDLLQGASPEQAAFVLQKPREALALVQGVPTALRDPRLSRAGNWLARHLTGALEALVRVENWLRTPNERELRAQDRKILQPLLGRVGDQAGVVAELVLGPDLEA